MEHDKFMKVALEEARKSLEKKLLPVGAVLIVDGKIVGKAHKDESHSYHLDHAEILLLREFFKNKSIKRGEHEIVIYTTLEPCVMCLGTILHLPVDAVVFSSKDPYGGGCSILQCNNLPHRHKTNNFESIGGILEKESVKLFKDFINMETSDFYSPQNTENLFVKYILESN